MRRRPAPPSCPRRSAPSGRARAAAGRGRRRPGPAPPSGAGPGVSAEVADQVVAYLGAGLAALGALPTRDRHRHRAGLRRERGHPAHRPLPVRRPHQPGVRAGPAQAVLRLLRLRAPGGRRRRHRGALPRAPAQLPAGPGARDAAERHGRRRPDPGGPPPSDARRPLAVEPQPGPRRATLPWRPAPAHPPPADGGRRPAGRQLAALAACQENAAPGPSPCPTTSSCARRCTDCLTEPLDAERPGRPARGPRGGSGRASTSSSPPSPHRWPTGS